MTLIFSVLSGWSSIISGMQACERRRSMVAMHQGAEPFLRGLFAMGLMWIIASTATIAMSGYVLGMALLVCSQLILFKRMLVGRPTKFSKNNDAVLQAKVLKYSWPMGVWGIFTAIQLSSDRWALQTFSNASDVGLYTVLYQLGFVPISLISGMAVQLVLPIMYKRAGDATNTDRIKSANKLGLHLTKVTLLLTGITFFVALIVHSWIFDLLVGERYRSVSYLLPWMVLAGGLFAGGQSLSSNLLVQIQTHKMLPIKIFTAILGVALNIIGAYYFGVDGIVTASCLFSITYLAWMYLLASAEKKYYEA
jgi:O-antigen/teichoic acid export membrane protein